MKREKPVRLALLEGVFICPKFDLIVEMKNIAGEVNFDEDKHQFTRKKEDGPTIGLSSGRLREPTSLEQSSLPIQLPLSATRLPMHLPFERAAMSA